MPQSIRDPLPQRRKQKKMNGGQEDSRAHGLQYPHKQKGTEGIHCNGQNIQQSLYARHQKQADAVNRQRAQGCAPQEPFVGI